MQITTQQQQQLASAIGVSRIQGVHQLGEREPSLGKGGGGGVGGFSPTSPKILISKTAAHQNNQSGNAFGKSKASTNIILFTNNNNNVPNGFGGNGSVNFTQINPNQPRTNNINVINNQMIPSAINQRNIVHSVVSFGNPSGNHTGPVTSSHVQSFESSYQQPNVNLKGVLSTNSFVNPTTYFATGQSPVSAQATQAVLSQIGVNSAYQQQQKIQSNKFTNNQAYAGGTQGPSQNQVIGGGSSNTENMKPTRIFIIDSYQDGSGQGTSSINQNHLLKEAHRTNGGGSFNDQSQQIKGIFQGSGTAALQNQASKRNSYLKQYEGVTVQTQINNGGGSKMKTHYPNNEMSSLGQNKNHMNQLTPKATHDNTLISRHTMGGASSQMSTIHNSNNIICGGNDLISGNAQITQTQSANNYNSKKGSKLQHHNRLILQGGQDIITGSTVSSSTPNAMQNHIMLGGVGPVAKTQYNGNMGNKNFGDFDEKRRNKQDLQLNEIIGVKKQVSVDCSSILDQRLAYNQGNNSPTIILKTTIAEQTTQHNQQQQRIRSFNYKTSATYDHYSYDPSDHQNVCAVGGGMGSTVLQSDDSFRRLQHGGQSNSHTQQLLPRPGVRMSLTKESNRQPILKQDRQYHNNPQTLIGAIIEGSSIQQSVKQHFSQTSNEKLKKATANMNRKHLIHQRIKCQGIPVVHNATQYNNQGNGVGGSSWATAPGISENTSSTHFSNFRSTNYGAGSEGIPSGKNSLSSGGIMSEHMKNGNTFSKMDASIFNSIAQTKEFQELAQTLSQISQNYQNGFNKHQQIFDQQETLQMIKNYSSILMKDTKFRDNVLLAANAHQGTNHTLKDQGSATPYIQYLIKNFKTKGIDYSGSKFGKYYHHNTNKVGSDGELVNHNTSTAIGEQDYENQGSLTRLHISNQRTQGGARSQTSLDKLNSDSKYSVGKQQLNSDQEGRDVEVINAALNQSQYAQSLRVKRYQTKNSTTNAAPDNTSSQENLHSPYKDQQSDSQRILNNQNQKSSQKLIQSLKRYASKERFQKLLDEIASTAMKESVDLEGNELFQQRLWEASQWLIQEQLKQRHNG